MNLEETAKWNQVKYVMDANVKESTLAEIKYVGLGNFKDGANWQKQQLLESAVDAVVHKGVANYLKETDKDAISKALESFADGDKVKVIIIKDEDV